MIEFRITFNKTIMNQNEFNTLLQRAKIVEVKSFEEKCREEYNALMGKRNHRKKLPVANDLRTAAVWNNLTPYERKKLYAYCEKEGIRFNKNKVWVERWVCRGHDRMLIAPEWAMSDDDLVCPKRNHSCLGHDDYVTDDCCDYNFVKTKVRQVTVYL